MTSSRASNLKNAEEELFVLYILAHGDMIRVRKNVEYIKNTSDEFLLDVLRRDAILSYCRPFSANRGVFKKRNLAIQNSFVPKHLRAKHDALMVARNQLISHMDLSEQAAILERYEVDGKSHLAFSVKGYELVNFSILVEGIEALATSVEQSLLDASAKLESCL